MMWLAILTQYSWNTVFETPVKSEESCIRNGGWIKAPLKLFFSPGSARSAFINWWSSSPDQFFLIYLSWRASKDTRALDFILLGNPLLLQIKQAYHSLFNITMDSNKPDA